MTRLCAAFAAWLLFCVAVPALAAVTPWTSDPTFADAAKNFGTAGTPISPQMTKGTALKTVYWGPRGGTENSPTLVVVPGAMVLCTWDGDATSATPDATVTLDVLIGSGTGASTTEWQEYVTGIADGQDCTVSLPCSTVGLAAGVYQILPSAQDANSRLKCHLLE